MATIPAATNAERHVRKTITFDGGAGSGAVGTVTVFTITGRVLITRFPAAFCSTGLSEAGATATLTFGTTNGAAIFAAAINAVDIDTGEWWWAAAPTTAKGTQWDETGFPVAVSGNLILTVGAQNVTGGVLVFDLWYIPITDNGALAGDDIDNGAGAVSTTVLADAVHDEVNEGSTTFRQTQRLVNSALGSKASGMGTTTAVIRDVGDSKDRVTATVDADGNRTAVTLDLT